MLQTIVRPFSTCMACPGKTFFNHISRRGHRVAYFSSQLYNNGFTLHTMSGIVVKCDSGYTSGLKLPSVVALTNPLHGHVFIRTIKSDSNQDKQPWSGVGRNLLLLWTATIGVVGLILLADWNLNSGL